MKFPLKVHALLIRMVIFSPEFGYSYVLIKFEPPIPRISLVTIYIGLKSRFSILQKISLSHKIHGYWNHTNVKIYINIFYNWCQLLELFQVRYSYKVYKVYKKACILYIFTKRVQNSRLSILKMKLLYTVNPR